MGITMKGIGWITLILVLHVASSAKILSILPAPIRSHGILYERLMKELANRGHSVTYLTPFPVKEPPANLTQIDLSATTALARGNMSGSLLAFKNVPPWLLITALPFGSSVTSDLVLQRSDVKRLIAEEKFDLIFGEPFLDESIVAGFSAKHKAPIVMLSTLMPNMWSNYASGNPAPSSYIPDPMYAFPTKMTFCQRIGNFVFGLYSEILLRVNIFIQDRVMRRHFGDDLPCIDSILRNTSLLLVNSHHSIGFPHPQLPNTVEVAGMHIYPPKPLPKDLEEYMSKSKNGVIMFSLGTNANSSDLPKETIEGVVKALGKLDEDVLWKFEKNLENLPNNVKIVQWLPQSDILAHPNLKLFITHGGMLSTTEAVYRGVPIVGIPIAADQPSNMKLNENAGLGKTILLDDLSEETLYSTVTEVLHNPKYRQAAKLKSKLLHDAVLPPLELAIWWIEYILRHEGAPHLRSASQDLYWFQLYQIDTIITLVVGLVIASAVNLYIFRNILGWIRTKKTKVISDKKQN